MPCILATTSPPPETRLQIRRPVASSPRDHPSQPTALISPSISVHLRLHRQEVNRCRSFSPLSSLLFPSHSLAPFGFRDLISRAPAMAARVPACRKRRARRRPAAAATEGRSRIGTCRSPTLAASCAARCRRTARSPRTPRSPSRSASPSSSASSPASELPPAASIRSGSNCLRCLQMRTCESLPLIASSVISAERVTSA